MQSFYLNTFDILVLLTVLLSALIAVFRGFAKELLSLVAWVGAAIVAIIFTPAVADGISGPDTNKMVAKLASGAGLFIVALITISLINAVVIHYIKKSEIGVIDRSLGLAFGVARGAFLVSMFYLMMALFLPKDNPPDWLEEAQTRRLVQMGADSIVALAPGYFENFMRETEEATQAMQKQGVEPMEALQALTGTTQEEAGGEPAHVEDLHPQDMPSQKDHH